ncbi:hypothetical protein V7O62_10960 [Methanolobus sp. ZRKC2]|uniref:hypothetical protein n=1 Tax=Methanolobus sp. ZRKC2 TaxID=3125783 RepID=UPI00324C5425
MSFQSVLITNEPLIDFFIDVIVKLLVALTGVSIIAPAAISFNKKIDRNEKNQYLKIIKSNYYIRQTFSKIRLLDDHKYTFPLMISLGMMFGAIYILIVLIFVTLVFVFILQSDSLSNSILFFDIDPTIDINKELLLSTYLNIVVLPLFLCTMVLFYLRECLDTKYIIKSYVVKKKRLGKAIQKFQYKIFNFAGKTKPTFNNQMLLTLESKFFLYLPSFLIGMFLMSNYIIWVYLYVTLNTDSGLSFKFSFQYFMQLYLHTKSILPPNWNYLALIFIFSLLVSLLSSIILCRSSFAFLGEGKSKIINYYSRGYPYVNIKTSSGSLNGHIKDVFNKHVIVLNEKGVQKLTSWNNIGIIEIETNDSQRSSNLLTN